MRLSVLQKRNTVDELMQRELIAAHVDEIVMALAGAGHQVRHQRAGVFRQWIRQALQLLMAEGLRTAGLGRINGLRFRPDLNTFLYCSPSGELNGERDRFARAQDQLVAAGEKAGGFSLYGILAALNGGKMESAFRIGNGLLNWGGDAGMSERNPRADNG